MKQKTNIVSEQLIDAVILSGKFRIMLDRICDKKGFKVKETETLKKRLDSDKIN